MEGGDQVAKDCLGKKRKKKTEDVTVLNEEDVVRKRYVNYFERLLYVEDDRKPVSTAVGKERGMNLLGQLREAIITREE